MVQEKGYTTLSVFRWIFKWICCLWRFLTHITGERGLSTMCA